MSNDLPQALIEEAQTRRQVLERAAAAAGIKPWRDSGITRSMARVMAFSHFVSIGCTRDPAMLDDLIASGDLQRRYRRQDYEHRLDEELDGVADEASLGVRLRRLRRREMVRIAWRDLAGWADLAETVSDLSAFADSCLDRTIEILYRWQCHQYGVPVASDGTPQQLVVLALGKLGARELNFSSDIDLIFAYPRAGKTCGTGAVVSNADFFVRLCRRLIRVIGQVTQNGFVFRVDARLRPFGESGPLAMDFEAMEHYYLEQGREWERYALIKARAAAGDKQAGNRLLQRIQPFIYRRYLDYSAFESLREMKKMISLEVKRKGMQNNIKIGPGGIREIEFFGQIFQLIRGGVNPALQDTGILKVLSVLAAEHHIPQAVCNELSTAYVFLRTVENRLQAFDDQQTHELPSDESAILRLAASMGLADGRSFQSLLEKHRQRVHHHFQMLLEAGDAESRQEIDDDHLQAVWQNRLTGPAAAEMLVATGYKQPDEVLLLLDYLRSDPKTRALSSRGRWRLDRLVPQLLKEIGGGSQPMVTLARIIDLIKAIERRTSYLALLLENPVALGHLIKLSSVSPWIASFLARHPVLLDELLDPRTLYRPPRTEEMQRRLRQRLAQVPAGDLEYQIEQLCIFKQINVLRVAAADVTAALPLMRVSDYLSQIAEIIVAEVVNLAWHHLVQKHGHPHCRLDGKSCGRGFVVIAYGKLGGLELGYGSDLDLVFLHAGSNRPTRGGQHPVDSAQFYNRLGQRVIHILSAHTRAGRAYDVDTRLRPSGSSGMLVSHMDAFAAYQADDAWTWEHQALIKARPIGGDDTLAGRFKALRAGVLVRRRSRGGLQKEVAHMREKMRRQLLKPEAGLFDLKQGIGGMVDIEFLVQYLVLRHAHRYPGLLQWTDNVRLIQALIETGSLDEYSAHILKHAYLIYRAAAHQLSLQEKPARVPQDKFDRLRRRVAETWQTFFCPPG